MGSCLNNNCIEVTIYLMANCDIFINFLYESTPLPSGIVRKGITYIIY